MIRNKESINSSSSTTRNIMNKGDVTPVSCILVFVVVIGSLLFANKSLQGAIQFDTSSFSKHQISISTPGSLPQHDAFQYG